MVIELRACTVLFYRSSTPRPKLAPWKVTMNDCVERKEEKWYKEHPANAQWRPWEVTKFVGAHIHTSNASRARAERENTLWSQSGMHNYH